MNNSKSLNFRSPSEFMREFRATQRLTGLTDSSIFIESCIRCLETRTLPFLNIYNVQTKKTHNYDPVHTIKCNNNIIRKIRLLILQYNLGNTYTLLYYGLKCIQGQYGIKLEFNPSKDYSSLQEMTYDQKEKQ